MSVLEIYKFPNAVLKKQSKEIRNINGSTAGMMNDMVDTMLIAKGIGLAAVQVGRLERAIVVDMDLEKRGTNIMKLINPEVVEAHGEITYEEGCLSVVNYSAEVTRPSHVMIRAWTLDQREIEFEADGVAAVCLQHEIDHLEGTLFLDHLSQLKRKMVQKRLRKQDADEASHLAPRIR